MIEESLIDRSLNRLMKHFGPRVIVRPPATVAMLSQLESLAGALPRDATIFYSTCNGLRVDLQGELNGEHLWCISEILGAVSHAEGPAGPSGLMPIRGDLLGERDWLVTEPGAMHGAVVRWDPWGRGEKLVASSFGHFVDSWTHYLTEFFDVDGNPALVQKRRMFNAEYAKRHDSELGRLTRDPDILASLHCLELQSATGDDFE